MIVTKDEDFALRVQATESGPCVVWLRVGNTSNTASGLATSNGSPPTQSTQSRHLFMPRRDCVL